MPSFTEIKAKAEEMRLQIEKLQSETAEQIKPLLQQFIADNPTVEAVRWNQYTPYWNDGDECVFRMGDLYFKAVDGDEEAGDYEDGFVWSPDEGDGFTPEAAKACRELSEALSGLEDELKLLFGDHVQVTVTKDGVDVEEYEHD